MHLFSKKSWYEMISYCDVGTTMWGATTTYCFKLSIQYTDWTSHIRYV